MSAELMSDARLAEIRTAHAATTPGRWCVKRTNYLRVEARDIEAAGSYPVVASTYTSSFAPPRDEATNNAVFIALAHEVLMPLVEEVEWLRVELERCRQIVADLTSPDGDAAGSAAYQRGVEDGRKQAARGEGWGPIDL